MHVIAIFMQHRFNWDSLRYVIAVAGAGNLSEAARELHVDRSTVLRKIQEFENSLDAKLFEITRTGTHLTDLGEELISSALRIEDEMTSLLRHMQGRRHEMTGVIRVTTSLLLGSRMLIPCLRRFSELHPGVRFELIGVLDAARGVSKQEADIAVRTVKNPKDNMVGKKIGSIAVSIYGTRQYLEKHGYPETIQQVAGHTIVQSIDSLSQFELTNLSDSQPAEPAEFRSNTLLFHLAAAKAGIGLASLPCYLADKDKDLVRVFPDHARQLTDLWIMTHKSMEGLARIRTFISFLTEELTKNKSLIEGKEYVVRS